MSTLSTFSGNIFSGQAGSFAVQPEAPMPLEKKLRHRICPVCVDRNVDGTEIAFYLRTSQLLSMPSSGPEATKSTTTLPSSGKISALHAPIRTMRESVR